MVTGCSAIDRVLEPVSSAHKEAMTFFAGPATSFDPTLAEAELLRAMILDRGTVYSGESGAASKDRVLASELALMGHNNLVTFVDAAGGGWDKGMWGATITCVGSNAAYRFFGTPERHVHVSTRCDGSWNLDGTCTGCSELRELDADAWDVYVSVTSDDLPRARLYCVEHGFMRERHVKTTKTCPLVGTENHDVGLMRM